MRVWSGKVYAVGVPVGRRVSLTLGKGLSVFFCFLMLFVVSETALYIYLSDYLTAQARTPQALAVSQSLPSSPAVDSLLSRGHTPQVSAALGAQLAADLTQHEDGKGKNHTHVTALDEARSSYDRVYLNADGTKSLVRSFQATSFRDTNGRWQDVNTSLVHEATTNTWHTKANAWVVSFGSSATYGVQIAANGQRLQFLPVGGRDAEPVVTGSGAKQTVTYVDVWQGVDLKYQVFGSELKESIVLKSRDAAAGFGFAIAGGQLVANPATPGSFSLQGAFSGFSIAPMTITTNDSESVGALPTVGQTYDGSRLHVTVDAAWLAAQHASSFPIVIDPTVFGPAAPADYYNFASDGTSCHGSVACGGQAAGNQGSTNWRFGFQTNLTAIPPGQFPLSATLHLAVKAGSTAASSVYVDHSTCQTGFSCYDSAWGESSASVGSVADVDVTNVFRGAMAAGTTMPWLMVRGTETTNANSYKLFDDTQTSLTITYAALPSQSVWATGSPADGGVAITTQPTFFSTTSTDSDGPGPLLYRVIVGTSRSVPSYNPYNLLPSVGNVIANSGQSALNQWTIPDGILQDGTTYYWQVSVWDSLSGDPEVYSPAYSFKVDTRTGRDATQSFDSMGPVNVAFATGNLELGAQSHSISSLGGDLGANLDYNSPQVSRLGMVGQYWNDPSQTRTFPSTAPAFTRVDPNVDFNWGADSPYAGVISSDDFLARWDGYFVAPKDGTYQFGTTSDDGSRIFLNGSSTAYLDQWSGVASNVYGTSLTLTAGQIVQVRYEYYEASGSAQAHFLVKTSDGQITGAVKNGWLQTGVRSVATPHGLVGYYYIDDGTHTFPADLGDPTRLFLTRTDASLSMNWGGGSPVPGGPTDGFMARWVGYFTVPVTDTYTFGTSSDDGSRIILNGNDTVLNAWTNHSATAMYGAARTLTAGQVVPIEVDYYENTGSASISLLVRQASLPSAPTTVVPSTWLTTHTQVLPDGWNLGIDASSNLMYDYAVIGQNDVTLHDSTGQTHEYTFVNGGFTPPVDEDGHMVRNSDGTITFQDSDGRTYVFNADGTLKSSSVPTDDLHPTALQYTYSGTPARLSQITDGVNASRWAKILYSGDPNCPSVPSGFVSYGSAPGMICAVVTSDGTQSSPVNVANGNVTRLLYKTVTHPDGTTAPALARVEKPGSDYTDYGSDTLGRIVQVRDTLANDAVSAGVRAQDGTEMTQIQYDALGRVSTVTSPAATAGAVRLSHTYTYYPQSYTYLHISGSAEPNGFSRKVVYDATYRTTDDIDIANLDTKTVWDPAKDLVQSVTDPAGMMSTTLYDYDFRPTDQYGPAPSSWFDTNPADSTYDTPLSTHTSQVAHTQTAYDGSINGLAAAYYTVDSYTNGTGSASKALFGNPKLHTTGIGQANGDVNRTWGGTPPFTPDSGKGWGVRLSGFMHFTAVGTYAFRIQSDDGVRLWVDDTLVINDWNDGGNRSHGMVSGYLGFANTKDSYHRIRLDYYNKAVAGVLDTDATLALYMTPPGGAETSALGSLLNPGYGLVTGQTNFDSSTSVGNTATTNTYGPNPELSLAQSSIADPGGLNLTTSYTYEAQGASGSYLRKLSKTLPGGETTNYVYWAATDTADNPCTTTVESFKQAGRIHTVKEPDPDGSGPQTGITTDNIYNDKGQEVATRYNAEAWQCITYDARGRMTQTTIPAQANTQHVVRAARTITNNWAVGGNPLVTSVADSTGAVTTTVDLLGRITAYTDVNGYTTNYGYDNVGRLQTKNGPVGSEAFTYDNLNRLSAQKLNGTTLATPTYDASSRLQRVTYAAGPLALTVGYDAFGRTSSYSYTVLPNGGTTPMTIADSVTYSQSGKVLSGTEAGAAQSYAYDKAARLTSANIGAHTFSYAFNAPTTCSGLGTTYNPNAGKSANRTSETVDGVTTTYCYDYADRLISDNYNNWPSPGLNQYDAHGNLSSTPFDGNNSQAIEYDASDRVAYIADNGGGANSVTHDPVNRLLFLNDYDWNRFGYTGPSDTPDFSLGNTGYIQQSYIQLPGGVLLSNDVRPTGAISGQVFSVPNIHGDVLTTVQGDGELTLNASFGGSIAYQYDPFGSRVSETEPDNMGSSSALPAFAAQGQHEKITEEGTQSQFIFMGARLYDPSAGRFTQVDPVEGGCANAYAYGFGDPVNSTDLSGTKTNCKSLADRINELTGTAQKRYYDILKNPLNLPLLGRISVQQHVGKYKGTQSTLRNRLKEWDDNRCGGKNGPTIRQDARWWSKAPPPQPRQIGPSFSIPWQAVGGAFVAGGAFALTLLRGAVNELPALAI